MTTRDFTANVISASKVVPDGNFKDSKASGVWDINEALDLIKGGNWPNAANLNPSAFVDSLFQTHLYDGTSADLSINNGINLSGSGGLVWFKDRNYANNHRLYDTARGIRKYLDSGSTAAEATNSGSGNSNGISAFNSNGFTIGNDGYINDSSSEYVSWTFRKQPKFFDIVTWSGNGGGARSISHNLGSTPGMMLVKRYGGTEDWGVYHRRGNGGTNDEQYYALLHNNQGFSDSDFFDDTAPTSTQFTVGSGRNISSRNYIAYLFAHNDDDGGFGEPGDQDIIKCGGYTGGSGNTEINLGFEPQFLMIKRTDSAEDWLVLDTMRGLVVSGDDVSSSGQKDIMWNSSAAEATPSYAGVSPQPNGFKVRSGLDALYSTNGGTYIYMAIRAGGMQTPTAASSVFSMDTFDNSGDPKYDSTHVVDMSLIKLTDDTGDWFNYARPMSFKYLSTNDTDAEANASEAHFDHMRGFSSSDWGNNDYQAWMWKKARGYFDIVTYTGTGSARTISHNLGVVPEMMWIKNRDQSDFWVVYHKAIGNQTKLILNATDAYSGNDSAWFNNTTPTSSVFSVGDSGRVNGSGEKLIAYLFATAAGVSKVGSYTGNAASDRVIDCGFTNGAKFVLIKDVDQNGTNWQIFDTTRGLTSTKAELLRLNTTAAQIPNGSPSQDYHNLIEPDSSGFKLNHTSALQVNASSVNYIFYAIANDPS